MSGVLVMAEARQGALRPVSTELITAAAALKSGAGGRIAVAVIDADPERFGDQLDVEGVDEILLVKSPLGDFEPHIAEHALDQLIQSEEPDVLLAGFTVDSMGFVPAVAAKNGFGFASDVFGVEWGDDGVVARRGAYGDRLVAELDFPGKDCVLLMIRPGAFAAATAGGQAARRSPDLDLTPATAQVEPLGIRETDSGGVDITKAGFILAIGRGIEDEDSVPQFEELAEQIGATLAVSRPLVDAGWVPSSRQVGQSGKVVQPSVYLALGISGAVQHLAGMQQSETIIAVNTDAEAPIFGVADYGAVADLFDVADALAKQLE
jgi:electron transfer flavoprotein alpha subunit